MTWRGRVAVVMVVAAMTAGSLGVCSDDDDREGGATTTAAVDRDRTITTPDGQVTLSLDGELPANWPADVPLPQGSTVAGSGSLSGGTAPARIAVFRTAASPSDAWRSYTSNTDLRTANPSSVGTGSAFVGTVELISPLAARVTVVPGDDGSYVIVTVPGSGAPDETTTTAGTASTTSTVPVSIPSTTSPGNAEGGPA